MQTFQGHIQKSDKQLLSEELLEAGQCRIKTGPYAGNIAMVELFDVEFRWNRIRLAILDDQGEYRREVKFFRNYRRHVSAYNTRIRYTNH